MMRKALSFLKDDEKDDYRSARLIWEAFAKFLRVNADNTSKDHFGYFIQGVHKAENISKMVFIDF